VKLLFDENLAPRLATGLADLYPGSVHLKECGLRGASDIEIWRYALKNGFAIVSKDSDFAHRSFLLGSPPKVIWLQVGNCTTTRADFMLRNASGRIQEFIDGQQSCLVLAHPRSR
jgi:predicted nuclease of predicted toxin-antitoxin system